MSGECIFRWLLKRNGAYKHSLRIFIFRGIGSIFILQHLSKETAAALYTLLCSFCASHCKPILPTTPPRPSTLPHSSFNCPIKQFRNRDSGIQYIERFFTHTDTPPHPTLYLEKHPSLPYCLVVTHPAQLAITGLRGFPSECNILPWTANKPPMTTSPGELAPTKLSGLRQDWPTGKPMGKTVINKPNIAMFLFHLISSCLQSIKQAALPTRFLFHL